MVATTTRAPGPDAAARRYATTGDRGARETLVSLCEPLVRGVARDYDNPGLSDDLVQAGFLGLLNAIEQFDPSRGTPFVLFARPYIRGEISHFLRDHHTTVRRPRWLEESVARIDRAADAHVSERRRYPSHGDLAAALGVDEASVVEVLRIRQTIRTVALDRDDDEGEHMVPTRAVRPWDAGVEDRAVLLEALWTLAPLQRAVVFYIFFTDYTQMETARRLGVSQKHVSRVLAGALLRLRRLLVMPPAAARGPGG